MSNWHIHLAAIALALSATAAVIAQPSSGDSRPLSIRSIKPLFDTAERCRRAEFRIDMQGAYANTFDPDEIAVDGQFRCPDGTTITLPAFYFQDYTRTVEHGREKLAPHGSPEWRLRFAPMQVGDYTVRVTARDKTGKKVESRPLQFVSIKSGSPGYVRRSKADWRYFEFDNGKAYIPIGANVCWGNDTCDYDRWLPRYGAAKCTYFRIWLAPGWNMFSLEHTGDGFGLGKYDQEHAWRLDYVLDLAAKQNLYVMLCINSYNELRRKAEGGYGAWEDSPHCAANGGPLEEPGDFWTNARTLRLYKNKLRYLVARFGWDPHLMSWEFWNEVDIISSDAYKPAEVTRWHAEMSDYLRGIDPWKRLQTTSFASSAGKPEIDKLPQIDYTQTHAYGIADGGPELTDWLGKKLAYKKPSYVGEFGADAGGSDRQVDPDGYLLHNGIWSTLLSGAAGSAMLWWWDNHIDPGNLYYHFSALTSFIKGIDFPREGFQTIKNASFAFASAAPDIPYRDLLLSGPAQWTASEENKPTTVAISGSGEVTVSGKVAGILHGLVNHKDLHNPLTLRTDLPHRTKVRISVNGVSGYGGAHLTAVLDNAAILDKPMPDTNPAGKHDTLRSYDSEYKVDIPAGSHTLIVENTGTDWMLVSYVVERAERKSTPDLRLYGMRGKRVSLIWIQNASCNYKRIQVSGRLPDPVPPTVLTLPNWPKGTYRVRFWDTYAGTETGANTAGADAGGLRIELPEIQRDIALKIERV